jgi:aminoglycoside phosphotransferase (APT) family kinase protein
VSPPDTAPRTVEPDLQTLRERLTRAAQGWSPGARVTSARRLAGGASSLTYLATLADAPEPAAVVKLSPPGLPPTRHRDVLRQARILRSLPGDVPAPHVLFTDRAGIEDGDLFAMSYCAGESVEPVVDEQGSVPPPADVDGRVRAAARVLASLHSSAALPAWVGEEPATSLADEVGRWDRALATLPGSFGLDWEPRSGRLRDAMPAPAADRLLHGDYRLGNLLCEGAGVTAVVDWEIWSVGDPRVDLGWFLLTLDSSLHPAAVRSAGGIPSRPEILGEYGGPVEAMDWFLALALYKFTATTGLIGKHALRRGEDTGWGARMIPRLPLALRRIDGLVGA